MWCETSSEQSESVFLQLHGEQMHVVHKLHEMWRWDKSSHPKKGKIPLRMTHAPSNTWINFHGDGQYATCTVKIALNGTTDYEGGRLCFCQCPDVKYPEANLIILEERPTGSVCRHLGDVLHVVTALTSGTLKSLFVVDQVATDDTKHVSSCARLIDVTVGPGAGGLHPLDLSTTTLPFLTPSLVLFPSVWNKLPRWAKKPVKSKMNSNHVTLRQSTEVGTVCETTRFWHVTLLKEVSK